MPLVHQLLFDLLLCLRKAKSSTRAARINAGFQLELRSEASPRQEHSSREESVPLSPAPAYLPQSHFPWMPGLYWKEVELVVETLQNSTAQFQVITVSFSIFPVVLIDSRMALLTRISSSFFSTEQGEHFQTVQCLNISVKLNKTRCCQYMICLTSLAFKKMLHNCYDHVYRYQLLQRSRLILVSDHLRHRQKKGYGTLVLETAKESSTMKRSCLILT